MILTILHNCEKRLSLNLTKLLKDKFICLSDVNMCHFVILFIKFTFWGEICVVEKNFKRQKSNKRFKKNASSLKLKPSFLSSCRLWHDLAWRTHQTVVTVWSDYLMTSFHRYPKLGCQDKQHWCHMVQTEDCRMGLVMLALLWPGNVISFHRFVVTSTQP